MLNLKTDLIFEYVKCNNRNYLPLDSTKVFHHFSDAVLFQIFLFHYKLLLSFFKVTFKFFSIRIMKNKWKAYKTTEYT